MSHSSVDNLLVRSPPTSDGSEEGGNGLVEEDEDEPVDNHGSRVYGLYGQEEESDDVEEGRQGKTGAPPRRLSAEQMRVHRLAHYPFRSWCLLSIAGRAKSWPHFRKIVGDDG